MSLFVRFHKHIILICVCFQIILCSALAADLKSSTHMTLKVHNVGQGNCITVTYSENGHEQHMLIDAGSSSYGKELKYHEQHGQSPRRDEGPKAFQQASVDSPRFAIAPTPSTPRQVRRDHSPPKSVVKSQQIPDAPLRTEAKHLKLAVIQDIRSALGEVDRDRAITVKTIVITHPDIDHYSWLKDIFHHNNDIVENIILAGLPEHYNEATREWLYLVASKGANVYFPAIKYEQLRPDELPLVRFDGKFAQHAYTAPNGKIVDDDNAPVSPSFQEAFQFGKDFYIY